ncbi:murein biosynthesis integral membrane protein MurJ, partial [Candidatus Aerophobetes bacterium]|nr:murein biosynthesis integral membrane protein MurJ [Candidatus Aerophobetes bacterium]
MKEKGFIRSAGIVSAGTFFSRITGLVRLQVIAYLFGYSQATDAFWLAFTLPNLLRALFAEGALSSAFIPVFSEYCATGKKEEALRLANNIIFFLLLITGLITACGVIFAPFYMPYFGIGFRENTQQLNLAILLTQMMWPFLIFISLAAISMAILNCWGHFFSPAFAPLFFNLSLIICGAVFISRFGIFSLAAGVLLGGALQFLVQLPSLKKRGFKFKLIISLKDEGTKKVLKLILPAILGNLTLQISVAITRVFASTLPEGSISGLQYAMRLIQFPLGIFPIALSTAIFPRLSALFSLNDMEGVKKTFLVGVKTLSFLLIPSSFGIILLREEIVRVLFQHGAFSFRDTLITSQALLCYTIGLFA